MSKFGFLSKITFLQSFASSFISRLNPHAMHNLEKYYALKKIHYLSSIENMEGDYLEFGVYVGSSFCASIKSCRSCEYLSENNKLTKFYGFDSFDGFGDIPDIDKHPFFTDFNFKTSYDAVMKRVKKVSKQYKFKLIKGFFNKTLSSKPSHYGIKKSRIIMIDSDTYQACKEALDFCLETLQEGTFIVFDDFMSYKGSYEKGEMKAFNDFKSQNKNIVFREVLKYGMGGTAFIVSKID
jgi:O-methyltransferase